MTEQTAEIPLHEQPEVRARRWWTLAIMCLSLIMVVMAVSGLNVALPTIQQDLDATGTQLLWIVDSYAIVFAGLLLVAGAIGDKWGRKGALQGGLVVFASGAMVAALANGATQVTAGRAVMGAGAAFIMPATLSIITAVFPPGERAKAIAIWAGFAGAGGAIGPIVTGMLLTGWAFMPQLWWGAAFLVNIPVILGVLVAVTLFTPKSKESTARPLDLVGGVLSIIGVTAILYAIIEGPEAGWLSPTTLTAFGVALVIGAAFVLWELRARFPMLPMELFRNRLFSTGSTVVTLVFFVMFAFFLLNTLFLQFVLGYSALQAGLAGLPIALSIVLVAPRSTALAARVGLGTVMAIGFGLIAGGLGLLTAVISTDTSYWTLAIVFVLLGSGLGLASAPATGAIMTSTPLDKAGVGSAVNDTTRELGGALGIAVGGTVIATFYASRIDLDAVGLPEAAVEAASESIGAAFGVAASLDPGIGGQVVAAARESFASAYASTMLLGAIVAAVAGVATWWALRKPVADSPKQAQRSAPDGDELPLLP